MKKFIRVAIVGAIFCAPVVALASYNTLSGTVYIFDFQNDGYTGAHGDWSSGSFKGQCNPLNMHGRGLATRSYFQAHQGEGHALLCNGSGVDTGDVVQNQAQSVGNTNGNNDERYSFGDWDPGFCKWTCNSDSVVTGVSEKPDTQEAQGANPPAGPLGGLERILCTGLSFDAWRFNNSCYVRT